MLDSFDRFVGERASQLGISLSGVAERSGLARSHLYKLLNRQTVDPTIGTVIRLARSLDVAPVSALRFFADLSSARALTHHSKAFGPGGDVIAFNADVTHADHAVMRPGEGFRKTWELHNLGRSTWSGRRLVRADQQYAIAIVGASDSESLASQTLRASLQSLDTEVYIPATPPGCCARVSVDFVAPMESCSIASIWRIYGTNGRPVYPPNFFLQVVVTVITE